MLKEKTETTWCYRVIKSICPRTKEISSSIYEVYSNDGKICSWIGTPSSPYGESRTELKKDLNLMKLAFNKESLYFSSDKENIISKLAFKKIKKIILSEI